MRSIVAGVVWISAALAVAFAEPLSDTAGAHVQKMGLLYQQGDLKGAISELRAALQLHPDNPDLHFMLGNALYRFDDMQGAAIAYAVTTDRSPSHFEAHMSRGFALYELGDLINAEAHWLKATRIEPSSPFARTALAVGLFDQGAVDDARMQYEVALSLDHQYADISSLERDIRWKPRTLATVKKLLRLVRDNSLEK
jgi:Flp pilus assembly protein TadD